MALRKYAFLTGALTIAILQGCGGDDSAPAATGGAANTGGSAGTGGGGTGGGATGGASGSTGTGGGGTGGSVVTDAASEGPSGPVCTLAQYTNVWRFAGSTLENWSINTFSAPILVPGTNAETGAPTGTIREVDPNAGNPAPGSAKLTVPYDAPAETLIFQQLFGPVNLTGTTLSALIRLDSIAGATVDSAIQAGFALKTTAGYVYSAGPLVNLQEGAWVSISMNADSALIQNSLNDTCDVREIDILISSGAMGTYGTAVLHVDTIAITAGDAGVPPEPEAGAPVNPDAPAAEAAADARDAGADRAAESAAPETGGAPDASE